MKKLAYKFLIAAIALILISSCDEVKKQESAPVKQPTAQDSTRDVYLNTEVILWNLSLEKLEDQLGQRLTPIALPEKDTQTKFLVEYLSGDAANFGSWSIYESDTVKTSLYNQKIVAVVGHYINLVQDKGSADDGRRNAANLFFVGTPVRKR
ncbi:MAG: hypothetical protein NTW62_02490 [Candidatus Nomurabacteria bacterium]|nr:hypothetical protein [Candidatus Nomurabacteria bacterium]